MGPIIMRPITQRSWHKAAHSGRIYVPMFCNFNIYFILSFNYNFSNIFIFGFQTQYMAFLRISLHGSGGSTQEFLWRRGEGGQFIKSGCQSQINVN